MVKELGFSDINDKLLTFYIALIFTGFGFLGLSAYLIAGLIPHEFYFSTDRTIYFAFLIAYAVIGIVFLFLGLFGGLRFIFTIKKNYPKLLETSLKMQKTPSESRHGLHIIRPQLKTKKDEIAVSVPTKEKLSPEKEADTEVKTKHLQTKSKAKKTEIPSDFSYSDGLQNIIDRYNTEKVRKAFKNWYNTLMITFPDISKSFLFKINGEEGLDFSEGIDENAAVQVNMDSTIFVKMMTKQINPIKAYSSGNLEVKGEMKNMLKLRKLMF